MKILLNIRLLLKQHRVITQRKGKQRLVQGLGHGVQCRGGLTEVCLGGEMELSSPFSGLLLSEIGLSYFQLFMESQNSGFH